MEDDRMRGDRIGGWFWTEGRLVCGGTGSRSGRNQIARAGLSLGEGSRRRGRTKHATTSLSIFFIVEIVEMVALDYDSSNNLCSSSS